MPKSWSFRASIPMRTGGDDIKLGRAGSRLSCLSRPLTAPARVIEPIRAEHIATHARVHVRLPRRFFRGDDLRADGVGDAANIGEDRAAGGRYEPRHRARLPQREPFA